MIPTATAPRHLALVPAPSYVPTPAPAPHEAQLELLTTAEALADPAQMEFPSTPAGPDPRAFEVGHVYSCRSLGDYDCIWSFLVVKRTAHTVTLQDLRTGETTRRKVTTSNYSGQHEFCLPHGSFSMAPSLTSDRPQA